MKIPVITLWQPWASLIADGYKTVETRTHNKFKGLKGQIIGIHAGKQYDYGCWNDAQVVPFPFITKEAYGVDVVPYGAIICTAVVTDVRELHSDKSEWLAACLPYRHIGLVSRFGLFLEDINKFDNPIPMKGQQGVWYCEL
jgi:hypothetical protein